MVDSPKKARADHVVADQSEIAAFLSYLAERVRVSPSTQNQALNGILFLYREVLRSDVGSLPEVVRAKRRRRLPVVLSRGEVLALLDQLHGTHRNQLLSELGLRGFGYWHIGFLVCSVKL